MQQTNIERIDLNLLIALQALVSERHVTRAAIRMGLTQPAMSHALSRLRAVLGDPILVRARGGLQLTPRAAALAEPLERVLADAGALLASPRAFDPLTSTRRFRIAGSDYIEIVLLPALLERIGREAPRVDVVMQRHDGAGVEALEEGSADALLVPPSALDRTTASVLNQKILSEKFVCVVREDHPMLGSATRKLTLEKFLDLAHVLISPRGLKGGYVDDALAKLGHTRRVAVMVPHFLVVPFIIERTDLVVTMPARIATALAPSVKLRALAPPSELELSGFDMRLVWHERDHVDPAHTWLRSVIASAARSV